MSGTKIPAVAVCKTVRAIGVDEMFFFATIFFLPYCTHLVTSPIRLSASPSENSVCGIQKVQSHTRFSWSNDQEDLIAFYPTTNRTKNLKKKHDIAHHLTKRYVCDATRIQEVRFLATRWRN